MFIAQDKSMRSYDGNGHLIVEKTIITKAAVNGYLGREIPNYENLGLDPNKEYKLLRDPEELRKALPTFKGVQLLIKHIPVDSEEPQKESTIGTAGINEVEMIDDDVYAGLRVYDQQGIDLIESGKLQELSAGYAYRADMTSGTFKGVPYDGVMRDIHGNHVAIVKRGRIGPDAIIADELPKILEKKMQVNKFTIQSLVALFKKKGLAMDEKACDELAKEAAKIVEDSDDKAKDEDKGKRADALREQIRQLRESDDDSKTSDGEDKGKKIERLRKELKDLEEADDDSEAKDEDNKAEDEQTQAERDNEAEGLRLKDREDRERKDRERDRAEAKDKKAMDAAIIEQNAVKKVTRLFQAREKVKPLVGNIACDSAEEVFAEVLREHGHNPSQIHPDAYEPIVDMLLRNKSKTNVNIAQDSYNDLVDDDYTSRFK